MKNLSKRPTWGMIVLTIGCAWLVAGCCCHKPGGGTNGGPKPGGPTGGPIIDITIGGGNTIGYEVDNITITATNPGNKLDPRFFGVVNLIQLMDRPQSRVWQVPGFDVDFLTGSGYKARKQANGTIEWKCGATTLVPGTQGDGIPSCMLGITTSDLIHYTLGSATVKGDWAHIETQ